MDKKLYKAGTLVYITLFIFSVIFYKERIINLDAALYLFNIVRNANFSIEHYRFIAVFTEIFPLIAVKLSLPLNMVMIFYSAGFIVYYFACYLLCGVVFKNYKLGLALLLYHILFTTHTFYWGLSEFIQAVSLMFPFMAFILSVYKKERKPLHYIIFIAGLTTLVFAHPLILFPLSFTFLFFLFQNFDTRLLKLVKHIVILFFAILFIKTLIFREPYDASSTHGLVNFVKLFPNYLDTYANKNLLANFFTKYYWIPILFIITTVHYYARGQKLKLLIYWVFVIGYLILINTSYPSADTGEFYTENFYLPIGVFLSLPLLFDVLPAMKKEWIAYTLFSIIILTCLPRIYASHSIYTSRLKWMRNYLDKHLDEKLIISNKAIDTTPLFMYWALPYEYWLLSTTEYGKTASVLIPKDITHYYHWTSGINKEFITDWGLFKYHTLPAQYFIFTDTATAYRLIE